MRLRLCETAAGLNASRMLSWPSVLSSNAASRLGQWREQRDFPRQSARFACRSSWKRGHALAISSAIALWARSGGRRSDKGACLATRQAPPRPPKEDPTPFPRQPIFPPVAFHLLGLFHSDDPDLEELIDALEDLQDLHETDRHWGAFPAHVSECRQSAYNKGQLEIVRGILRSIEQSDNEDLRTAAVDTLLTLLIGGCVFTRCPASFVVEAGAVKTLCDLANETEDASTLEILLELVRLAPETMLPDIVEQGAVQACVKILENSGSSPMDQLSALNLLLALSKRAPAPVAQSNAYDVVKDITNVALVPRRNKIMSFLRPLVQHDGDVPPLTNIRTGGLKY